ncbi:hypothetical protein FOA52_012269, partial [Chlamydomonas sp. UWO 241]
VQKRRCTRQRESSDFSNAADKELIAQGYAFGRAARVSGAVAIISNDTGFCGLLRYLGSLGVFAASVAPHKVRRTQMLDPRGPPLERLALPRAAHLALMWSSAPGAPVSPEEAAWAVAAAARAQARGTEDGLGALGGRPGDGARGGPAAVRAFGGPADGGGACGGPAEAESRAAAVAARAQARGPADGDGDSALRGTAGDDNCARGGPAPARAPGLLSSGGREAAAAAGAHAPGGVMHAWVNEDAFSAHADTARLLQQLRQMRASVLRTD